MRVLKQKRLVAAACACAVAAVSGGLAQASVPPQPPPLPAGTPSQFDGYPTHYLYVLAVHWARSQVRLALPSRMMATEPPEVRPTRAGETWRNGPPRILLAYVADWAGFPTLFAAVEKLCTVTDPAVPSSDICEWQVREGAYTTRSAFIDNDGRDDGLSGWVLRHFDGRAIARYARANSLSPRGNELLNEWYFFPQAHSGLDLSFLGDLRGHASRNWVSVTLYRDDCPAVATEAQALEARLLPLLPTETDTVQLTEPEAMALGTSVVMFRDRSADGRIRLVYISSRGDTGDVEQAFAALQRIRDSCAGDPAPDTIPAAPQSQSSAPG